MKKVPDKYYIWVAEDQDGLYYGAHGYKTMEDLHSSLTRFVIEQGVWHGDTVIGYEIDLNTGECEPIEVSNGQLDDAITEAQERLLEEE